MNENLFEKSTIVDGTNNKNTNSNSVSDNMVITPEHKANSNLIVDTSMDVATEQDDVIVSQSIQYINDNRPAYKLSVKLIETYKYINKVYYDKKAQKLKEKQDLSQNLTPGLGTGEGRNGVHNDGYDDANYDYILASSPEGEIINGRYIVKRRIGKGSFGQVICAYDQQTKSEVAIKIIKSKKAFFLQAQMELELLNEITNKQNFEEIDKNCVSLVDHFIYRNHQCLVFEMLSINLYELLKNSRFKGVSLTLVRKFGRQILSALEFLARPDIDIVHCDLKPENILLRHPKRSAIKLIDFGSSCKCTKRTYSYIQSRFYRSPEVLLGLPYNQKIDIWSLGCVLVEMHTGEPLFGGKDQLDQLFRISDVLGMPPFHMIEASPQAVKNIYFEVVQILPQEIIPNLSNIPNDCDPEKISIDPEGKFCYVMRKSKNVDVIPRGRSLLDILGVYIGGPNGRRCGEIGHTVDNYLDFYELMSFFLCYDPSQRLSASDALNHHFFTELAIPNIQPIISTSIVVSDVASSYDSSIVAAINEEHRIRQRQEEVSDSPRHRARSAPSNRRLSHTMTLRSHDNDPLSLHSEMSTDDTI